MRDSGSSAYFVAYLPCMARHKGRIASCTFKTQHGLTSWRRMGAGQMAGACRGSLRRLQLERAAIGQLHWSAAKYAPFQERALWDGLVRMYGEVSVQPSFESMPRHMGASKFGHMPCHHYLW